LTLASLSLRLKDLLGPVTSVEKKKKKQERRRHLERYGRALPPPLAAGVVQGYLVQKKQRPPRTLQ